MEKISVLVVEDEIIIADNLCDILEELGYNALEPALNYTEAMLQIKTEQPDIAILDIALGGKKTGIDLAAEIRKNYNFPFIFLTSNTDPLTVEKAKKVNPPAYLTKPFTKDSIYATLEITLNNSQKIKPINEDNYALKDALFIKEKGTFQKINFKDIRYLKSDHVYTEIKLNNETVKVVRIGLNSILNKLNNKFVRVHRSYIINCDYLTKIDASSLLISTEKIPIGAKFKTDLLKNLNLL
tara:strand:+ start:4562 stop:5281 length:720 start_codon:yes stop_codon:yes gene_type:complete